MADTGIIILAAGASSRLGKPKQLLVYQHKTLLQHVADEAKAATLSPIVVVTGANASLTASSLTGRNVLFAENERWPEGMASSVVAGLSRLLQHGKKVDAVILAVCDQPHVSAAVFRKLVAAQKESGKGMVASQYEGINGTPVLFTQPYFQPLQNLRGNEGARKLLKFYHNDVAAVPFPAGGVDIDTEDDYRRLLAQPS